MPCFTYPTGMSCSILTVVFDEVEACFQHNLVTGNTHRLMVGQICSIIRTRSATTSRIIAATTLMVLSAVMLCLFRCMILKILYPVTCDDHFT